MSGYNIVRTIAEMRVWERAKRSVEEAAIAPIRAPDSPLQNAPSASVAVAVYIDNNISKEILVLITTQVIELHLSTAAMQ